MNKKFPLLTLAALVASISPSAHAYLDPGTGSMILQMLIAGIVGALFTIKIYWYRLKGFFARLFGRPPATPVEHGADDPVAEQDARKSPD